MLSNGDESKVDAVSNQLPVLETMIGMCCRMRKVTSDARRFHLLPVPAVLGVPCDYIEFRAGSKNENVNSEDKT